MDNHSRLADIESSKLTLQAMLREGKHPVETSKRYPDGSELRLRYEQPILKIEDYDASGVLTRRDIEVIVPKAATVTRVNRPN